jgi:pimeloyl-ACP methyl ester carboxylesterase
MFEPLFARLADRYHLAAPDYPGVGHSDWPDPKQFAYTFDHYAEIMNHFTEGLGLSRYTLCMQDYGGPVGFRTLDREPQGPERSASQPGAAQAVPLRPVAGADTLYQLTSAHAAPEQIVPRIHRYPD